MALPTGDPAAHATSPERQTRGVTRVLVVSDTHLHRAQESRLADLIAAELDEADLIVHAGDIVDDVVLEMLARHAPVHAVRGNNDHGIELPERIEFDVDGCRVAAVHDSGPATGRVTRLRRWFPDADVVLFGHSHLPWHQTDVRSDGHVQHHVNPGSAIQRRRAPHRTVAWLEITAGRVAGVRHVALP
jgi:putative phosphoesterase